ncbi:LPS assembly protein LptD [Gammaproteobacteria bacterium]|nr:LPS assembly protein LptD [Gammaproteobacteria bacterium]
MKANNKDHKILYLISKCLLLIIFSSALNAKEKTNNECAMYKPTVTSLSQQEIAAKLGWISAKDNHCNGFYLEKPFFDKNDYLDPGKIRISGNQGIFSLHGTSTYQGKVTINQNMQQVTTNKAYVYRNPATEEYSNIDLTGNINFREPNSLILAHCGHINLENKNKLLRDILYRTAIYGNNSIKQKPIVARELQVERKIYQLSAWGKASEFKQDTPKIYIFKNSSYSTCTPTNPAWQINAKNITLDKNSGRGIAKNATIKIKNIPVFYIPYLNFPIDNRRKTGFLWPSVGSSSTSGFNINTPFYWNLAPNYDDTITPAILTKRGLQITNLFRYLSESPFTNGQLKLVALPYDSLFREFQKKQINENQDSSDPAEISQINTLKNASTTRGAVSLQQQTQFNKHWTTSIDFNWVSDDYYLKDFSYGLNEITPNQILQQADLSYKSKYWNFTGRLQGYQTLHPIEENVFYNQYIKLPQIVLDGSFVEEKSGLNIFINNDLTHFDIKKNPGNLNPGGIEKQAIGNRINIQPGISLPIYHPSYYINPRLQLAMTNYNLSNISNYSNRNQNRVLPIFDISSGLYFDRNISLFNHKLRQTLEPKMYYTYVPYKNQNKIPNFDTTINTLTYDQLFIFNRFSGLDRIGDANQISLGITTRFMDLHSGVEKISAGIGQIIYFKDRRVTLCETQNACEKNIESPENTNSLSPLSAVFSYKLNPFWNATSYTIWDPQEKEFNNQTFTLQYVKDIQRAISFSYSYVRNGDLNPNPEVKIGSSAVNLSQTDLSFTWPITQDLSTVARWTENWNRSRFQNLLYGLQYDTCCWAVRIVAGRTFNSLTANNTYKYNTEFYIQFALKGLGNFGTGNPGQILNNVNIGNQTTFGQDY